MQYFNYILNITKRTLKWNKNFLLSFRSTLNASVRSETPPSLKLLLRQEKKKMKLEVRATTSSCTTSPNQIRENANPRRAAVLCGNKVGNSKATD